MRMNGLIPPALPGASPKGWGLAAVGALVGISMTGLLTGVVAGSDWRAPLLMAPLAASSVLLFGFPASPMARPWAIIVGHVVSALVGVVVAHLIPNLIFASGLAVALAILAMAATRSMHPPGGSTALIAVLGGPGVKTAAYSYALLPVGVNTVLLVGIGWLFHRWVSGHSYPHASLSTAPAPASASEIGIWTEDIEAVIARYGDILDIDRSEVEILVREAERAARLRRGSPTFPA